MHRRNEFATFDVKQMVYDFCVIAICYLLASAAYRLIMNTSVFTEHVGMAFSFSVVFILSMMAARMYNVTTFYYKDRVASRTLISILVSGSSMSMMFFLLKQNQTSRLLFVIFLPLCFVGVITQRFIRMGLKQRYQSKSCTRSIFFGDEKTFQKYSHYVKQTATKVKFIEQQSLSVCKEKSLSEFGKYLAARTVNEAVFVYTPDADFNYEEYLCICEDMGITARLIMNMFELPISQRFLSSMGTYPVVTYHSMSLNRMQLFIKSVIDYTFALLGSIILSPIFLVAAIAIKLDSPGPVIFKQERAGKNGKVFKMYKFRTMVLDAETLKDDLMEQNKIKDGMMFKMDDDPRITKVGAFLRKTSIDELPQLWNILRGEMSIVGTRPPTLDEVKRYKRSHWRRISIKPGITGMWQVSGRSDLVDFEDVVALDKRYIDEWSLGLDFKLIFRTISVVLLRKGSY
ncbi:MAG: sugar transferase [Oscillospiraceae bacterium]